jgi:hypothetical protein
MHLRAVDTPHPETQAIKGTLRWSGHTCLIFFFYKVVAPMEPRSQPAS